MKRDTFLMLLAEYRQTRDQTTTEFIDRAQPIIDEYGLKSFHDVAEWIVDHLSDSDVRLSHDASVAKLHVAIRKMLTLVNLRIPEFAIHPEKPTDEVFAELMGHAFPTEVRRTQWPQKMRMRNLWSLMLGFGATEIGVSSTFIYDDPAYTGRIASTATVEDGERGLPYGPMTEYSDPAIVEGEANVSIIPSTNLFSHPWDAPTQGHVMRWYIRYQRPLIDIYRDTRLSRARGLVRPIHADDQKQNAYFSSLNGERTWASKMGETVKVFDVSSRKFCIIADGVDEPLMDWTPFTLRIDSPIRLFVPIESLRTWRGIPYALRIVNQARAINQLRAALKSKIARDGKTIYFYDPLSMTPEDVAHINQMQDGEFMPMPGLSEALGAGKDPFKVIEFGKPSAEMMGLINMFENDFREGSGLDNPALNVANSSKMSATESYQRSQQTNLDITDYVTTNEESQEELAKDYLKVCCQKWPQEKLVKITGINEYSYFWVPTTRDMMLRNFTLEIVAGSTQKLDKATYTANWIQTIARITELAKMKQQDAMAAAQGMATTGINWDEVIRVTCDLFDPTISKRILNQRDPTQLLIRLMREYGIIPSDVSPDVGEFIRQGLQRQAEFEATGVMPSPPQRPQLPGGGQQPQNVVPFEVGAGVPSVAQPSPQTGQVQQQMPAFQSQRMMSRSMGSGGMG